MITVMQVCGANKPGGAESHFLRFCVALDHTEAVRVVAVVRKGSWLAEQFKATSVRVYELPFMARWDLYTRYQLKRIAQREQAQVAQCWMSRAASLMPSVDGTLNLGRLGGYYALKNFTRMHWLVGATDDLARHIRDGGHPAERTAVIPNFVNPARPEDPECSQRLRQQLRLEGKKVLFTPARLHGVKGLDTAIAALTQLPEQYVYIIAGQGPEEASLRQQVVQLGLQQRVHFVGWTDNISQYCYISDLFIVPSRHEPFGSVLLEAWSHQLPLISSDSQGASAITRHEDNALIFPKDDSAALQRHIMRLADDEALRQQLIHNGYATLNSHYATAPVMQAYIDLYRRRMQTEG